MNKLSYTNTFYCWARFICWNFLFCFLIILTPVLVPFLFAFGIVIIVATGFIAIVVVPFFITKFSLKKLFFKPYRYFVISPKFKEIPNKIVFLVMLLELIIFVINGVFIQLRSIKLLDKKFSFTMLFFFVTSFFIIKSLVEDNTFIQNTKEPA